MSLPPDTFVEQLLDLIGDLEIAENRDDALADGSTLFGPPIPLQAFRRLLNDLSEQDRQIIALDWPRFATALHDPRPTKEALRAALQPMCFRLGVTYLLPIEKPSPVSLALDSIPEFIPDDRLAALTPLTADDDTDRIAHTLRVVDQADISLSDKIRVMCELVGIDEAHPDRAAVETVLRESQTRRTITTHEVPLSIDAEALAVTAARTKHLENDMDPVEDIAPEAVAALEGTLEPDWLGLCIIADNLNTVQLQTDHICRSEHTNRLAKYLQSSKNSVYYIFRYFAVQLSS